ncbi:hypothetical protein, partial [Treponema sp.]|uniref:hypothetical protein n=1 Tax=Treponema sp. TaxID=166 RepID=UPI00388CFECB
MENAAFFHYKTEITFLHRIPSWLKIILILILALAAFYLPVKICLIAYPVLILFSAIFLKFTPYEIFSDQKPSLAYIFLLYFATILLNIVNNFSTVDFSNFFSLKMFSEISKFFIPNLTYLPLLAHLTLSLEITSIFYRTTSHGQFKDGFSTIEMFLTH